MDYEEKILKCLVEGYRKSRKDAGNNKINRRTKLKPEKLYNKYHDNDGDFEKISLLNNACKSLEEKGFIVLEYETFGTELQSIYLADDRIQIVEKYLAESYGYESKDKKLEKMKSLADKYIDASNICRQECELLYDKVKKRQVSKNIDEFEDVLKAVSFIENNKKPLYLREVSMEVYHSSKYFEEKTLDTVCSLLQKYNKIKTDDTSMKDEILGMYGISREPQKISIKGKVVIRMNGIDVDISAFDRGVDFEMSEISKIESIKLLVPVFMTIENRTSYLRYDDRDSVIFYLGGYASRDQRDFIKIVCECNPDAEYLHFGDIDAGGLWIHHNLCEIIGRNFEMFCMSKEELMNPDYTECIHELSKNDAVRLKELGKIPEYKEVSEYMLDNNVKLEQEIISLRMMQK